jgi:hypothetical protein
MAVTLDRLKSQLLTSGLQQENFALFQVINQLIDFLRAEVTATQNAISGSSGGGGGIGLLGATYLTKNKEVLLPNSLQEIAGAGIQFNDAGGRRIISTAIPFIVDGEDGEQGIPGNIGGIGPQGISIQGMPGLDGLDGQEGESLIPGPMGPQGPTGGNSGRVFWFDITDASDIAGYKKALDDPSPNVEAPNTTVCALTTDNLLYSFASEPGQPNVSTIPSGAAFRHIHAKIDTVAGVARFKVEQYYCNADGSGETPINQAYSATFNDAAITEIIWDQYDSIATTISHTQRLVWKLYVARVSGPANVSVTTYFEGTVNPSYVQSTISSGSTGAQGIQGIQGIMGFSGLDGDEGLDSFIPGPQGIQGISGVNGIIGKDGIGIPGLDAEEPELVMMIPGPIGLTGPAGGGSSLDVMASRIQMRL